MVYVPFAVVDFCQDKPLLTEEVIITATPVQIILVLVVSTGAGITEIDIFEDEEQLPGPEPTTE